MIKLSGMAGKKLRFGSQKIVLTVKNIGGKFGFEWNDIKRLDTDSIKKLALPEPEKLLLLSYKRFNPPDNLTGKPISVDRAYHILKSNMTGGGHHRPSFDAEGVEFLGYLTPKNKLGVYEAKIKYLNYKGIWKEKRSTFFPDDWSAEKVMDAIDEAYRNPNVKWELQTNGRYRGVGENSYGVDVLIIKDSNGNIITAHPEL